MRRRGLVLVCVGTLVAASSSGSASSTVASSSWTRTDIQAVSQPPPALTHEVYGGSGGQYVGQEALFPCVVTGHRVASPVSGPRFVQRLGATISGVTAWTDTHAVHGQTS
jgi:hypothetical protein